MLSTDPIREALGRGGSPRASKVCGRSAGKVRAPDEGGVGASPAPEAQCHRGACPEHAWGLCVVRGWQWRLGLEEPLG